MKKFAFITGAVSISLTGLGIIFKMNQLTPGIEQPGVARRP
ncbi:MAG: hypothetical protein NTX61_17630 [Bacteroidetes bacterium]|nr:hypothetical protein [Bacteroidota bacterium]